MAIEALTCSIDLARLRAVCSACSLRELCLPSGLKPAELEQVDKVINRRRRVARGEFLYRAGAPFDGLSAVRTGFFKSCVVHNDGRQQVTGFHMMGEIIGMDAIGHERHCCDAIALTDSVVCEIPFNRLEPLCREISALQHHFHRLMSREIMHDHGVMLMLGNMRAEERVGVFLFNLSQRFAARGYSGSEFNLPMTREDIGSYLGVKPETVSRTLASLQEAGLVSVKGRTVRLMDLAHLEGLAGRTPGCPADPP